MNYDNIQMPVFGTISSYMIYFQVYPPFIGLSSTDFKKILVMFRLRDNFHVRHFCCKPVSELKMANKS